MIENGYVARLQVSKAFGFISNGTTDFFFHRDDVGRELWNIIVDKFKDEACDTVNVTFERWNAPKGMRAANIKVI